MSEVNKKGFRDYMFTLHNLTEEDYVNLQSDRFVYIVAGLEYGREGTTIHLQGYCRFKDAKTLTAAKKCFNQKVHLDVRRGSIEQAIAYCKKDEELYYLTNEVVPDMDKAIYEYGTKPCTQEEKGKKGKDWWLANTQAMAEHRYQDIDTEVLIKHHGGLAKAAELLFPPDLPDTEEQHLWYYGESRTGKSRKAREDHPNAYLKSCNKWWDNYKGEEVVIIEDVDPSHGCLLHHFKIWTDRYKFKCEFKGGMRDIRPKLFIITSNHHPNDVFNGDKQTDMDRAAILERFKLVHFRKL